MRRSALLLAAALAALPGPSWAAQKAAPPLPAAKKIFPFPVEARRLPNGLGVLFVTYDSPGLAAYFTLVRTGSRNEVEPGRSGFAHFFEHMMFRGTEKYPKEAFDAALSRAGLSNNAFTTDDFTAYHCFGPAEQLPLVVEVESDRFQNLKYSEDDFRTEARAVLGEYNKNFSNPTEKMDEVLHDLAYTRHTYKHTTMGFKKDVEAMPSLYAYSLEFFKRWYTPDNSTIVVVGDFDHDQLFGLIEKAYGGWKGQASRVEIPAEPKQARRKAALVKWDNPTQPRLMIGWHTPAARSQTNDSAVQNVLGPYLFGPTSPTYQDLVLERQLLAGLMVGYFDHRDPSLFYLLAVLKSEKSFGEVQAALKKAIADLSNGKVDLKRLEDVKSNQKYGLLNHLDNAEAVAEMLVLSIGPTGDPEALNALFNHMERLTGADLVRFAKAHFAETNQTEVALVGAGAPAPAGFPEYRPSPLAAETKEGGK